MLLREQKGVNEPLLPRKRKAPARFEPGSGISHHHDTPKDLFRQNYFECFVTCIRDRFNQPGYKVLKNLKDLLLKASRNESYDTELQFVLDLYKDDFQPSSLRTQLELLTTCFSKLEQKPTLLEVQDYFKSISPAQRDSMSEVCTLFKR